MVSFFIVLIVVLFILIGLMAWYIKHMIQKSNETSNQNLTEATVALQNDLQGKFQNILDKLLSESKASLYKYKDTLVDSNKNSVEEVLKPLKEDIMKFQNRSNEIHNNQVQQVSELNGRLEFMLKAQNRLTEETNKISNALKTKVKLQGNLGESMLKRVLESSGLKEGIHYGEQVAYTTENGKHIPDFTINLPDGRNIIIDAKMSLNSYIDYSSSDEEEKENFIKKIEQSFKAHVKSLQMTNYASINSNPTQAVLLFIPIESIYLILAEYSSNLFLEAAENKIYIVTSITLMPLLQIIDHIWKVHNQDKNTKEMANIAGKIHDKFASALEGFDSIRKGIDQLYKPLDDLEKKFKGRDNLVKNVLKLQKLGANTNKKISEHWLEDDEYPQEKTDNVEILENK